MIFKRKIYNELLQWKRTDEGRTAVLIQGARRVGKSTIAEEFATNEYETHILVDFAACSTEIRDLFNDVSDLNRIFMRLQLEYGVELKERKSVIIFDEVQLAPKARQAIKYLVKDGRYDYIETGSLISIRKNVKDILIPSEEVKLHMFPMDYEEFCWACGKGSYALIEQLAALGKPVGNATNRTLMRDFRIYMAVGGMPQAVDAYIQKKSFESIDRVKREIIQLYASDFKKVDPSGRLSAIFEAIPAQLAAKQNRFRVSTATGKRRTSKDEERLYDLIDSRTVLPCYNVADPGIALAQSKNLDSYKLYLADTGLFVSMMFNAEDRANADIYKKLLSDNLSANLGYLYENAVAQIIASSGRGLYYHTWTPEGKSHSREVDFLLPDKAKIAVVEVKSSNVNNHTSINEFGEKYSKVVSTRILFSQKDASHDGSLKLRPLYLAPAIIDAIGG